MGNTVLKHEHMPTSTREIKIMHSKHMKALKKRNSTSSQVHVLESIFIAIFRGVRPHSTSTAVPKEKKKKKEEKKKNEEWYSTASGYPQMGKFPQIELVHILPSTFIQRKQ